MWRILLESNGQSDSLAYVAKSFLSLHRVPKSGVHQNPCSLSYSFISIISPEF